jgi:hypothetical protein
MATAAMRSAAGLLCALGLSLGSLGLVHCSSSSERDGFVDPANGATSSSSGDVTPPSGDFGDASITSDATSGVCTEDVDVVFVLDVSSSMGFVLDALDKEIDKVVDAANKLKAGAHFGLVLFVDNVKLVDTGDLNGGKVHTKADSLRTAFTDAKATYTTPNRNPGDGPSGPTTQNPICEEDSLDALHDAANEFPWRSNAARVVILVTDDTFLEKPDNYGDRDGDGKTDKTSYPKEGNYPARFSLDETILALKTGGVRVFSFTKLKAPGLFDLQKCGTGRRHSSDEAVTYGWSKPYDGKQPIPTQTGGKNFDLDAVRDGKLSLATTINEVVLESHCAGPPK